MTPDQIRRLRECVFDTDITDILDRGEDPAGDRGTMMACLTDIRDILTEPIPLHDPYDWLCAKNIHGEPTRSDAICPVCRPGMAALRTR